MHVIIILSNIRGVKMNEKILVGQHLVGGFDGFNMPEDVKQAVKEYKIGNFILFSHNVKDSVQLKALCKELKEVVRGETGFPPFIFIDQEGGVVTRLKEDASITPGAMAVSSTGEPKNAYTAGLICGRELNAIGVNFNLAPVFDINSNEDNPVIGVRSYGDTPEIVSEYACNMAKGLFDGGVYACAKHFPGHGDTNVDSHIGLPRIDKTVEELMAFELVPFIEASKNGISGIMSSHILFPKIEEDNIPATLSYKIMTELLRNEIGFKGLTLSDCMQMAAIAKFYGTVQGMLMALKAGVDVIFASHDTGLCVQASTLMQENLKSGDINKKQFDTSTNRILECKKGLENFPHYSMDIVGSTEHREKVADIYTQSIVHTGAELPKLGDNPYFVSCRPFVTTLAANPAIGENSLAEDMQKVFGGECSLMSNSPDSTEIETLVNKAKGHSSIVVGSYNAHIYKGQEELVHAMHALNIPMVVVALRNPYDVMYLPKGVSGIAAYSYNESTVRALVDILSGKRQAIGKIPLKVKEKK